jgi:dTDP-4-dehydrorhamnose 3,5-epimerase
MNIIQTAIDGVWIIEPAVHQDHRGFFLESYNKRLLGKLGLLVEFIQDNHSLSSETGTVRGLHYQLSPMGQTKLVRVLAGSIFDVAVDIRPGSATFGKWVGVTLSDSNMRQLLIPKGFAHGFCTLAPNTQVAYKVDQYYSREHDRGIRYDDPDIGITWPQEVDPLSLSAKDAGSPGLGEAELDREGEGS